MLTLSGGLSKLLVEAAPDGFKRVKAPCANRTPSADAPGANQLQEIRLQLSHVG